MEILPLGESGDSGIVNESWVLCMASCECLFSIAPALHRIWSLVRDVMQPMTGDVDEETVAGMLSVLVESGCRLVRQSGWWGCDGVVFGRRSRLDKVRCSFRL